MPSVTKSSLRPRLLNGQTGDPALLVSLRWQGRALLVDLGRIDRTPGSVLLPIESVFVSHAHIDPFMGFSQLLRLLLACEGMRPLFGPLGIADCVQGKLAGYTWNLTDEYAFTLDVVEIDAATMHRWRFAARNRFAREALGTAPFSGVCFQDSVLTVEAALLDHKISARLRRHRAHASERPSRRAGGRRPASRIMAERPQERGAAALIPTSIEVAPGEAARWARCATTADRDSDRRSPYVVDTLFAVERRTIVRFAREPTSSSASRRPRRRPDQASALPPHGAPGRRPRAAKQLARAAPGVPLPPR
jgi:hypothetical protein